MKHPRRKILLGIVFLFGFFVLFLLIEHFLGSYALHRWKKEMLARGEKLTIADLTPPPPRSEEKFKALIEATEQLKGGSIVVGGLKVMGELSPGYAQVGWMEKKLPYYGIHTNDWPDLERQMQSAEASLRQIRMALKEPPRTAGWNYNDPFKLPSLLPHRRNAQWLTGAAINDLHHGRLEAAVENLHAIVSNAQLHRDEPGLLTLMVRRAISEEGSVATWEALQAPGWSESQLINLQKAWQSLDLFGHWPRAFEMEYAHRGKIFELFRKTSYQELALKHRERLVSWGLKPPKVNRVLFFLQSRILFPFWKFAWADQTELASLKRKHAELEIVRSAAGRKSWAEMGPQWEKFRVKTAPKRWKPWVVAYWCLPVLEQISAEWGHYLIAHQNILKNETRRSQMLAAIALKRYQLRHGKTAPNLASLVPEFLSELPRDYMSGRTLLYELNPDESFVLYSVGLNGRDDDGLIDDMVWPLPGFPEEIPTPNIAPVPEALPPIVTDEDYLTNVIKFLVRDANVSLTIDPVKARILTEGKNPIMLPPIRFEGITTLQARNHILGSYDLTLVRGPKKRTAYLTSRFPWELEPAVSESGQETVWADPQEEVTTISLPGARLDEAVRALATRANFKPIIDPGVEHLIKDADTITGHWEGLTARQVLVSLLAAHDLVLIRDSKTKICRITVKPPPGAR